ncbi:MAG: hypothetical protein PHE09_14110 [Oscillospiraceae bacterium]|nr:hypothetical protein [Oscillospiraceae bacterium]
MKNIHEILVAMGIEVPAEKKADLDKELLANYRTLADYEKQANKLKLAEEKVGTTAEALKQFEGVDVSKLQNEIEKLKGALSTVSVQAERKIKRGAMRWAHPGALDFVCRVRISSPQSR